MYNINQNEISKFALPLFLFWPFGGFLLSLTNLKVWSSGLVFVLFCTLYGLSFSFENTSADAYRVAFVFQMFEFSTLKDIYLVYREGGSTDIYRYMIYGITKIFTNNPKVLYAFFGTVFGLFLYLSMRLMVIEKGIKNNLYFFLIILFFFSILPIPHMNGARFNTAAWLFFYSTVNFLFLDKKRWALGVIATPLFHFSFLFIILFVFIFYFFRSAFYSKTQTHNWLFYFYVFSLILFFVLGTNVINIGFLSNSNLFSESITNKIDLYASDAATELYEQRAARSFFIQVSTFFRYLLQIYFLIFIIRSRKIISLLKGYKGLHKYFAFILFFLSIANIANTIPSGSRFILVGYMFVLYLFIKLYKLLPSHYKNQVLWGMPVFSFYIAFGIIFMGITLVSPIIWYGNSIWLIIEGLNFDKILTL